VINETDQWLSMEQAAKHFGYARAEGLRQRLRELRKRGKVLDQGTPPDGYKVADGKNRDKIIIYWLNARTALIRKDVPPGLLIPKRGKRARNSDS